MGQYSLCAAVCSLANKKKNANFSSVYSQFILKSLNYQFSTLCKIQEQKWSSHYSVVIHAFQLCIGFDFATTH